MRPVPQTKMRDQQRQCLAGAAGRDYIHCGVVVGSIEEQHVIRSYPY